MKVQLIGGPCDGEWREVIENIHEILFPRRRQSPVWAADGMGGGYWAWHDEVRYVLVAPNRFEFFGYCEPVEAT